VQGSASDSASGLIELAVQSEMEAATDVARAVVPGRQHYHPGHPKAWVKHAGASTIEADYGVSSIDDNGTGNYTINFDTAFSAAHYAASLISQRPTTNSLAIAAIKQGTTPTAAAMQFQHQDNNGNAIDPPYASYLFLGDHA
jgi:hypothetical protein